MVIKIKIPLTEAIKTQARIMAEEFHALDKKHDKHLFKDENPDVQLERKRISYLGELAFEAWLNEQKIPYDSDNVVGRSDKYDFLINKKRIDVKTTTSIRLKLYDCLFLNKIQADKMLHQDYYVFIVIRMGNAEIVGFEKASEVPNNYNVREGQGEPSPCYEIGVDDLTSVKKLKKEVGL